MRAIEKREKKNEEAANPSNPNLLNPRVNWRSAYKLTRECNICGSTQDVQSHHIKHVRKGKITGFAQVLNQLNRRQIVCCAECHKKNSQRSIR